MIRVITSVVVFVSFTLISAYSGAAAQIGLGIAEREPVAQTQGSALSQDTRPAKTFIQRLHAHGLPRDAKIAFDPPLDEASLAKLSSQYLISKVNYDPDTCRFTVLAAPIAQGQTLRINGCVSIPKRVPVLAESIQRGDLISDKTIIWENRDLPQNSLHLIASRDIDGSIARRNLPAGTIIGQQDIEFPTLIERGASVALIYVKRGLRISSRGTAAESAKLGDLIAVRIGEDRRTITARVTGPDEAIVQ